MVSGPAPNGLSATPCVVALTHDAALHRAIVATRGMTHCARERVPGCSADTAHRVSSPTFRGSVCLSSTHFDCGPERVLAHGNVATGVWGGG